MAHHSNADDGQVSGINVTPLVDITLVLLIIFMVTAKIVVSQAVTLDFPKESPGQEVQLVLAVELHGDGEILVDTKRLPNDESVFAIAKELSAKHEDLRAVIRADSSVAHGRVIRVLDLLKQAGITKIAFGVNAAALEPAAASPAVPLDGKR